MQRPNRWVVALVWAGLCGACTTSNFKKVLPADAQVNTFNQSAIPKVDVLWVVDNSPSMITKQQELAHNFQTFFQHLVDAGVNFHLALTSTDTTPAARGQFVQAPGQSKVITKDTANGAAAFEANVGALGTGTAFTQGLNAARDVLLLNPPDFLRSDAYLFLIFVSDADDNSQPADPWFFYRYYAGFKGPGNDGMILSGAIIGDLPNGCFAPPDLEAAPGARYQQLIQNMKGQTGSICDADFTATLDQLGLEAVGLQRKFTLSQPVDATTIQVNVSYPCTTSKDILSAVCSGAQTSTCSSSAGSISCAVNKDASNNGSGNGWTYDSMANAIIFDGESVPPKGATVEVIYYQPGKKPH